MMQNHMKQSGMLIFTVQQLQLLYRLCTVTGKMLAFPDYTHWTSHIFVITDNLSSGFAWETNTKLRSYKIKYIIQNEICIDTKKNCHCHKKCISLPQLSIVQPSLDKTNLQKSFFLNSTEGKQETVSFPLFISKGCPLLDGGTPSI